MATEHWRKPLLFGQISLQFGTVFIDIPSGLAKLRFSRDLRALPI